MVQVPVETKVSAPPEVIVQTPVVLDERLTVSPDVAVAVNVGVVPPLCAPGLAKVMVWVPFGVTLFDADEALPVPTLLVAVTVLVFVVPLVCSVTATGLEAPVPVRPSGLEVTV